MPAYLTVVFNPEVPVGERERLLASLGNSAATSDEEANAYCVEVSTSSRPMWWAQQYADLEYGDGKMAVFRVSYTTSLKELRV